MSGVGGRRVVIAAVLLIVIAIPWMLLGLAGVWVAIVETTRTCEPTVPVCRSFAFIGYALALLGLPIGIVHLVAGVGILRRSGAALKFGWLVVILGVIGSAYVTLTQFKSQNGQVMAILLVLYVLALGLLVLDRRRLSTGT
jgi:hypothetical protein